MRAPGGRGRIIPGKTGQPRNLVESAVTDPTCAKPASQSEVITDSGGELAAAARQAKPDPRPGRSPSSSACIPHRDVIELGLSRGRNAMAIWQELVDTCGFAGGYQSVRRFVSKLHGSQHQEACAVIETAAWRRIAGRLRRRAEMVRDPQNSKYRRTRLFVLTLGYSRKSVRLLVFRSSSQTWAELHEKAFRRLGGVTRVVVLDNLREGVLTPDIYDPTLALCTATCSGTMAPCRCHAASGIRIEKEKWKALLGMRKKTPLKGLRFEKLEEARKPIWITGRSAGRIHAFTAPPSGRSRLCSLKNGHLCCRCRSSRCAITCMESVRSIWMAVWRLKPPTTARRLDGSEDEFRCSGIPGEGAPARSSSNGQLLQRTRMHQKRGGHRIKRRRPVRKRSSHRHAAVAIPRR